VIDLHCHILPRIDDGARDLKTAFKMASIAVRDGIDTVVATPHILDVPLEMRKLRENVRKLNRLLVSRGIDVTLIPGAEVSPFAFAQINKIEDYTVNGSRYLLVEFPCLNIPEYFEDLLFNLLAKGMVPVLAHPERNSKIIENPSRIKNFLKNNVLIQITSGSITGLLGSKIKKCAEYMLENNLVDVVASDAHSARRRPPVLSEAYGRIKKRFGRDMAVALFYKNPKAIIQDKELIK